MSLLRHSFDDVVVVVFKTCTFVYTAMCFCFCSSPVTPPVLALVCYSTVFPCFVFHPWLFCVCIPCCVSIFAMSCQLYHAVLSHIFCSEFIPILCFIYVILSLNMDCTHLTLPQLRLLTTTFGFSQIKPTLSICTAT